MKHFHKNNIKLIGVKAQDDDSEDGQQEEFDAPEAQGEQQQEAPEDEITFRGNAGEIFSKPNDFTLRSFFQEEYPESLPEGMTRVRCTTRDFNFAAGIIETKDEELIIDQQKHKVSKLSQSKSRTRFDEAPGLLELVIRYQTLQRLGGSPPPLETVLSSKAMRQLNKQLQTHMQIQHQEAMAEQEDAAHRDPLAQDRGALGFAQHRNDPETHDHGPGKKAQKQKPGFHTRANP